MGSFFSYKLDVDNETLFRNALLPTMKNPPIAYITALGVMGFFILDFLYHKNGPYLIPSLLIRFITIILLFFVLIYLKRQDRFQLVDIILFITTMIFISHMHVTSVFRTLDHNIAVWDSIVLIAVFLAVPMSLPFQTISAIYLTIGSLIIWIYLQETHWLISEFLATFSSYIFCIGFGAYFSIYIRKSDRTNFLQLQKERKAKIDLENALKEIRMLQGIIPICARCKKIRDDDGYWSQIETYIERYSEALFSHGICPDCADEIYGDQEWYKKQQSKK